MHRDLPVDPEEQRQLMQKMAFLGLSSEDLRTVTRRMLERESLAHDPHVIQTVARFTEAKWRDVVFVTPALAHTLVYAFARFT